MQITVRTQQQLSLYDAALGTAAQPPYHARESYKLKGLRNRLIQHLRAKGIRDEAVLAAMQRLQRHLFIHDQALAEQAYDDRALAIGSGQTISQPYTVAYMTELLQVQPGMRVLEIGTGSGYQAAVLAIMGAQVYSVERVPELHRTAKDRLAGMGLKVQLSLSDGTMGWPQQGPFDRIIVTAGAPGIPPELMDQLAVHGRMVIPVGTQDKQEMALAVRHSATQSEISYHHHFKFVPLIGRSGWQ